MNIFVVFGPMFGVRGPFWNNYSQRQKPEALIHHSNVATEQPVQSEAGLLGAGLAWIGSQ